MAKITTVAIRAMLSELQADHARLEPACTDQGPATCPAWTAIYTLRAALDGGPAPDWPAIGLVWRQQRGALGLGKSAAPKPAPIYGRWLIAKYGGECCACGAPIDKGQRAHWGADRTLACEPCGEARQHIAPDPEAIRAARQAKADKRAARMLAKAARLERDGEAKTAELRRQDWAWATQPVDRSTSRGRAFANQRDKIRARADDGMRALAEADKLRQYADWTRREGVAVKGDAERRYQAERDANDARIRKGARVHSALYGPGVVVGVYTKSYRVQFDRSGHPFAVDKCFVTPLD